MRASKQAHGRKSDVGKQDLKSKIGIHISGAEGICDESEISNMSTAFIKRALTHPRGQPDNIVITAEEIIGRPAKSPLLPMKTLACTSPEKAWDIISQHMTGLGISGRALRTAYSVLGSENTMRGASLVFARQGKRAEPDRKRGVRVSRMGIDKASEKKLSRRLSALKIDTLTVREALILASKVASCNDIIAEICISDDPDYIIGYMASREFGYLRIPNIKRTGELRGGRIFFVRENAAIGKVVKYLENMPVLLEFK